MIIRCVWKYHGPEPIIIGECEPLKDKSITDCLCPTCAESLNRETNPKISLRQFVTQCGSQVAAARKLKWNESGVSKALSGKLKARGSVKLIMQDLNIDTEDLSK